MSQDGVKKLLNQLAKNPNSALFAAIAEELRKQGRYSQALEVCRRGLERNPRYANGFFTCGLIYMDVGSAKEALAQFRQTLELDGDHLRALEKSAEAAIQLKDWQQALGLLERLLTVCPINKHAEQLCEKVKLKLQKQASLQRKQAFVSSLSQNTFARLRLRLRVLRHLKHYLSPV